MLIAGASGGGDPSPSMGERQRWGCSTPYRSLDTAAAIHTSNLQKAALHSPRQPSPSFAGGGDNRTSSNYRPDTSCSPSAPAASRPGLRLGRLPWVTLVEVQPHVAPRRRRPTEADLVPGCGVGVVGAGDFRHHPLAEEQFARHRRPRPRCVQPARRHLADQQRPGRRRSMRHEPVTHKPPAPPRRAQRGLGSRPPGTAAAWRCGKPAHSSSHSFSSTWAASGTRSARSGLRKNAVAQRLQDGEGRLRPGSAVPACTASTPVQQRLRVASFQEGVARLSATS